MVGAVIAALVIVAIVLVLLKVAVAGGILGLIAIVLLILLLLGAALMTIGASIFLIAVGAILYFAANVHVAHVSIDTVGLILMLAGGAGLVLGFIQQAMWSRRASREVTIEERRNPDEPRY